MRIDLLDTEDEQRIEVIIDGRVIGWLSAVDLKVSLETLIGAAYRRGETDGRINLQSDLRSLIGFVEQK